MFYEGESKVKLDNIKIELTSKEVNVLKSLVKKLLDSYNYGFSDEIELRPEEWDLLYDLDLILK
jgi:hypothetical protein